MPNVVMDGATYITRIDLKSIIMTNARRKERRRENYTPLSLSVAVIHRHFNLDADCEYFTVCSDRGRNDFSSH